MSLAKHVIGGTAIITVAGIGARILSFLTVPIMSRLLGPEPYGEAALVGTTVSIATVLALLGIDMAYARFYLQGEESQRLSVEKFCWRFAIVGSLAVAFIAGVGWYFLGGRWVEWHKVIAGYVFIAITASVISTMAKTRVRLFGNYRKIAFVLFIAAILSAGLNITIALLGRHDVWALLIGTLAGSLTTILLLGIPAVKQLISPARISPQQTREIVSLGLAGSVTAPVYWLISSADRWFIGAFVGVSDIGIYSMASSVAMLGLMLNNSLTLTWFPEASRAYGAQGADSLPSIGRLWTRMVVGLAVVWVAITASGGDTLRLLAAPAFHGGVVFIPWLAGGVFFYGLASMANTQLFLSNQMRYAAYWWLFGGALNLAFNFLLVPKLGALGAAIAQGASYMVIALGIIYTSQRLLPMPIESGRLIPALILSLISGAAMSPPWHSHPLLSLLFKFPIGLLLIVLLLRIIAPDWYLRALAKLKDKILPTQA